LLCWNSGSYPAVSWLTMPGEYFNKPRSCGSDPRVPQLLGLWIKWSDPRHPLDLPGEQFLDRHAPVGHPLVVGVPAKRLQRRTALLDPVGIRVRAETCRDL